MRKTTTGLLFMMLASTSIVLAHHAFSSEFDANKTVTLTGKVDSVDWKSPHVRIQIDAEQPGEKTTDWQLEGADPSTLEKHGWSSTTIKKGDRITAKGYGALDGSKLISARTITLASGRNMVISDAAEDGGPAAEGSTSLPKTSTNIGLIGLLGLGAVGAALTLRKLAA
jgi:hypothetical protein